MKAFEEVINETVCGERGGVDRLASEAVCEGGETAKRAIRNLIERQRKYKYRLCVRVIMMSCVCCKL